jgi:hypothetical protein
MTVELTNDHIGFAIAARRIGDLLAGPAGVNPEDATTAAQWLLPLPKGVSFAPERAEGLQFAAHYDAQIRALAAAALRSPAALDLVTRWNAVTTPHEGPLRYLTRWTTAPAT